MLHKMKYHGLILNRKYYGLARFATSRKCIVQHTSSAANMCGLQLVSTFNLQKDTFSCAFL